MSDNFSTLPIDTLLGTFESAQEAAFLWMPETDQLDWVTDESVSTLKDAAFGACKTGQALRQLYTAGDLKLRDHWISENSSESVFVGTYRAGSKNNSQWYEERLIRLDTEAGSPVKCLGLVRSLSVRYAELDELTGHLSRSRLRMVLTQRIQMAKQASQSVGYGLIGINNITGVNSAFGYEIADTVLVETGKLIARQLQPEETLGRVGRSRFGIVFGSTSQQEMRARLSSIQATIRDTAIETDAGPVALTASAAGIIAPDQADTIQHAFSAAEDALAKAKGCGADQVVIYSPDEDIEEQRRENIMLANDLLSAIRENRLCLAYQPIVDANDPGRVAFYECLLRLIDPSGKPISAGVFMPIAEKIGFVRMLDKLVLGMAFQTLCTHDRVRLSINLSPQSLRDAGWMTLFDELAGAHPNVLERLILEITELTAINDMESMSERLRYLRSRGCAIALDDFGAGYTSFQQFKSLDLDIVKIDGSFIRGVLDSKESQLFVRALSELAKNYELMVIAEMVENDEAGDLLRSLGIDAFQSFYFGMPEIDPDWLHGGNVEQVTAAQG